MALLFAWFMQKRYFFSCTLKDLQYIVVSVGQKILHCIWIVLVFDLVWDKVKSNSWPMYNHLLILFQICTKMYSRVGLIWSTLRYRFWSGTSEKTMSGDSKNVIGISLPIIQTRHRPFQVYLVIYSSKVKNFIIFAILGALHIRFSTKNIISR